MENGSHIITLELSRKCTSSTNLIILRKKKYGEESLNMPINTTWVTLKTHTSTLLTSFFLHPSNRSTSSFLFPSAENNPLFHLSLRILKTSPPSLTSCETQPPPSSLASRSSFNGRRKTSSSQEGKADDHQFVITHDLTVLGVAIEPTAAVISLVILTF
ncbi:hypothetical protein E3N88_23212 [Mikania micrantha]|uniref:Uncharacterized protein n=1 Tax=Mikania micrantha TaxID=192012 RepID=A0A5N6NCN7_9ASTR|nr:hypothetical protein E3N88_23212 [Mikania micrantha]